MNTFDKRVALTDVRPSTRLYPVFSVTGSVADLEDSFVVLSPPYTNEKTGSLFAANDKGQTFSMRDWNVKGLSSSEQYNFHALFRSKQDAEEYAKDINEGNLNKELAEIRDRLVGERQAEREMEDDNW